MASSSFGGHTPAEALRRLCETLDGFDADSLVADNARTRDGAMVFVVGEPCGDCGGSGRYVGLSETSDCEACRGRGRV